MMLAHRLAYLFAIFVLVSAVKADTISLKNGDHLTGTIGDSDGKTLTIKTDYAGEVKVQWSAIEKVVAAKPVYVATADKRTVSGTVTPDSTNLEVHTATATEEIPFTRIAAVRSAEGQAAYEKSLHPGFTQDWKGSATLGFSLARGNSDTTNLNTAFTLDRKTLADHIAIYESSIYATSSATKINPAAGVSANAILGGGRYDRNLTPNFFGFVSGDFTHDQLQSLDLRSIYSGGFGWHAINHPNTTFDVLGGINYTRETYSGDAATAMPNVDRNLPGITFGEDFIRRFGAVTTVTEHAYFYPDLSDTSQYRFSLDAKSVTQIKKWLGWQLSLSDRYVTDPPIAGTKSNDVILSTGVNFNFSH
jgi:putative salt-induced outer membrane protein YdiY